MIYEYEIWVQNVAGVYENPGEIEKLYTSFHNVIKLLLIIFMSYVCMLKEAL